MGGWRWGGGGVVREGEQEGDDFPALSFPPLRRRASPSQMVVPPFFVFHSPDDFPALFSLSGDGRVPRDGDAPRATDGDGGHVGPVSVEPRAGSSAELNSACQKRIQPHVNHIRDGWRRRAPGVSTNRPRRKIHQETDLRAPLASAVPPVVWRSGVRRPLHACDELPLLPGARPGAFSPNWSLLLTRTRRFR